MAVREFLRGRYEAVKTGVRGLFTETTGGLIDATIGNVANTVAEVFLNKETSPFPHLGNAIAQPIWNGMQALKCLVTLRPFQAASRLVGGVERGWAGLNEMDRSFMNVRINASQRFGAGMARAGGGLAFYPVSNLHTNNTFTPQAIASNVSGHRVWYTAA